MGRARQPHRVFCMSQVVVLGITGRVGSRIAAELLRRGHQVTGIARNVDRVPPNPGSSSMQRTPPAPMPWCP